MIKSGDLCEVIGGMHGDKSPNLGLIVSVISFRGEHSKFGRIWRCKAEYAELGQPGGKLDENGNLIVGKGITVGEADFAQDWLKKIEPPKREEGTVIELEEIV